MKKENIKLVKAIGGLFLELLKLIGAIAFVVYMLHSCITALF